MSEIDVSGLAIDREALGQTTSRLPAKRRIVSRYIIPGILIAGFAGIVVWAGRDVMFPPLEVTVPSATGTKEGTKTGICKVP